MESLKKYANPVTIGLAVALVAAIAIIIYLYSRNTQEGYTKNPNNSPQHNPSHHHNGGNIPPYAVETAVGGSNRPALVLFWGSFCGHSTAFKPEWDKAARILNNGGQIQALDFELETPEGARVIEEAKKKLGLRGYPEVRFFPDGFDMDKKSVKFDRDRSEESLVKFAYENAGH